MKLSVLATLDRSAYEHGVIVPADVRPPLRRILTTQAARYGYRVVADHAGDQKVITVIDREGYEHLAIARVSNV